MILPWLLYSSGIGLLLVAAAWLLEYPLRSRGRPVRWIWLAALVALLVIPVLASLAPDRTAPTPLSEAVPALTAAAESLLTDARASPWWRESLALPLVPAAYLDLDPWLLAAWGIVSVAISITVALSYGALSRRRRRWRRCELDGRSVWVSSNTGPAVVGVFPGRIVVPEWLLHAPVEDLSLVLTHEEEHIRAGDPRLLLGVLLVCIALPWNPTLWWIWRSLRRAVEIDCDRRVLARGADVRAYGRLLLDITERGTSRRLAVAALSESQSFLERRIRLMIVNTSPGGGPRGASCFALALVCVLAACQLNRPQLQPIVSRGITMAQTGVGPPVEPAGIAAPVLAPGPLTENTAEGALDMTMPPVPASHYPEATPGVVGGEPADPHRPVGGNAGVVKSVGNAERRSGGAGPNRYAQTGLMYLVRTELPGREVRIRLEGAGAADPGAFRISGRSFLVDGVLSAVTPFNFVVTTVQPFKASLVLQGAGQMSIESESPGRRSRLRVRALTLGRHSVDTPTFAIRGDGDVASISIPAVIGLPASTGERR